MYVLTHRKSRPTGKKIAAALGMKSRFKTPITGEAIAIRWGSAQFPTLASEVQDARAIGMAGNKLVTFQCFKRDGVPCPEFSTGIALPTTETWFGRKTHGMCGTDIQVFEPGIIPAQQTHDFYSKYIPSRREYRIHVFGDQILGVMGKYLDFPGQAGNGYIKNHVHGYRFRTPDKTLNADRTDAAIAACKSLGLDFGAVDLIVGEDGKAYVLEVNTAPALAPLTARKYLNALATKLGVTISEDKMGAFAYGN